MLWRRYADPRSLLHTYSMAEAVEYIVFAVEQEREDRLWEMWIQGNTGEKNFKDFKDSQTKSMKSRQVVFDEEKTNKALKLIKIRGEDVS